MKKTLGFVAVVALSGLITVSCSSLNKMKKRAGEITYSVTPETLVAKGGMVDLKIDVTFPAKYFNKKASCLLTVVDSYYKQQEISSEEREKSLNSMIKLGLESALFTL